MSAITTHVLDTTLGKPARGLEVILEQRDPDGAFVEVGRGKTDDDGRCKALLDGEAKFELGVYRLTFDTGAWFAEQAVAGFFPVVTVVFECATERHYHVPLLLSPYGYSTYRGT
jgi:5-hydroxyisourate hydrolase